MKDIASEHLLTRFLLGEIDEHERAAVEDRLLTDEDFYEQLTAAEGDLIDAYVRGELPAAERVRFENRFLASPRLRERVEFARGLAESATRQYEQESPSIRAADRLSPDTSRFKGFLNGLSGRPALSFAFAVTAVLVIAVAVWIAIKTMRVPVEPQQSRTEGLTDKKPGQEGPQLSQVPTSPTPAVVPSPARDPEPTTGPTRPVFATATLMPGALRDGAATGEVNLPATATHLRLRLQLEADHYQTYRAVVSTPEGARIWAGPASKDRVTNANSLTLTLPASLLKRGDYVVEVTGAVAGGKFESAAGYSFHVSQSRLR